MMLSVLLSIAIGAVPAAAVREPVRLSEVALYAADFDAGIRHLDMALKTPGLDSDGRLELLAQKLRLQQNARLAGRIVGDEQAVAAEVESLAKTANDRSLKGVAEMRLAITRYFTALLADDAAKIPGFVPVFLSAAEKIEASCPRSEALFFAALMPQVAGQVAASRPGLEAAQKVAAGGCALEQSYIDRHFAAVAEDAGDLAAAHAFAAKSSATRREIGFQVFLPFSLLLEADLEAKNGKGGKADALVREAAGMARRLKLPAASVAACDMARTRTLVSDDCAPPRG